MEERATGVTVKIAMEFTNDDQPRSLDGPVGVYLTNGAFLYRVVALLGTGNGHMVELEDCYGLDVVRVPATDLPRLRLVTPG